MIHIVAISAGVVLLVVVPLLMAAARAKKNASGAPHPDAGIVGVWTIQGGDYPLTNEYRADGTMVQRVGGRSSDPSPYRIEGDRLVYSVKQHDGTVFEQAEEFRLAGDTLTFIDSPSENRVFRRNRRG